MSRHKCRPIRQNIDRDPGWLRNIFRAFARRREASYRPWPISALCRKALLFRFSARNSCRCKTKPLLLKSSSGAHYLRFRRPESSERLRSQKPNAFQLLTAESAERPYAASGCATRRKTLECSTSASIFRPRKSSRIFTRSLAGRTCVIIASKPTKAPCTIFTLSPCESE
jgi:hypothetical protein